MLVGNGGSVLFYVVGHDATVTRRLVEFLQQSDFAGVIFTKQGFPGTFHLDDAKIDNPHAPDVVRRSVGTIQKISLALRE